eukprot:403348631
MRRENRVRTEIVIKRRGNLIVSQLDVSKDYNKQQTGLNNLNQPGSPSYANANKSPQANQLGIFSSQQSITNKNKSPEQNAAAVQKNQERRSSIAHKPTHQAINTLPNQMQKQKSFKPHKSSHNVLQGSFLQSGTFNAHSSSNLFQVSIGEEKYLTQALQEKRQVYRSVDLRQKYTQNLEERAYKSQNGGKSNEESKDNSERNITKHDVYQQSTFSKRINKKEISPDQNKQIGDSILPPRSILPFKRRVDKVYEVRVPLIIDFMIKARDQNFYNANSISQGNANSKQQVGQNNQTNTTHIFDGSQQLNNGLGCMGEQFKYYLSFNSHFNQGYWDSVGAFATCDPKSII